MIAHQHLTSPHRRGALGRHAAAGRPSSLAAAIERIGTLQREVNPDLFSALVQTIVGQQISAKALATVWRCRFRRAVLVEIRITMQYTIKLLSTIWRKTAKS